MSSPESQPQKLALPALTLLVIGSMVGAGIFSLPRTFAGATGPLGAVIAWIIAGTGMYMLARVFQALAERKPDLDAGVFGDANTVMAIVVASIGIWLFHFMILKGVQQAAFINTVVTFAKIIPILVFIVILIFAFRMDLFSANLYGGDLTGNI